MLRSWIHNVKVIYFSLFRPNIKPSQFPLFIVIFFLFATCSKKTVPAPTASNSSTEEKPAVGTTRTQPKKTTESKPKSLPEPKTALKVSDQIDNMRTSSPWVDSVFKTLTPEERIAQLIMFDAYSFKGKSHLDTLIKLVKDNKIGGLIFLKGGPGRQINIPSL